MAAQPEPSDERDPGLSEIVREEAEGMVDRLEVLLDSASPGDLAEAQRLAHNLKGLAVTTEALPLRDLARSMEGALAHYHPDDPGRRAALLGALDAARGLIGEVPDAGPQARAAAAALEMLRHQRQAPALPWARRALARRLAPLLQAALDGVGEHVGALRRGRNRWRERLELAGELELCGAGAGLLGWGSTAALVLPLASLLRQRQPGAPQLETMDRVRQAILALRREEPLDFTPSAATLRLLAELRQQGGGQQPGDERLPVSIELPWADVDLAGDLLLAIDRLAGGRPVLDARPGPSTCLSLRGTLGLGAQRRGRRDEGGSIQVARRRMDQLLGLAEQLVALRARTRALERLAHRLSDAEPQEARLALPRLQRQVAELDRELDHLARANQEAVLRARQVPVRALFALARSAVREHLSRHPDKAVQLELDGAHTRLDKGTLDALLEPMLQLVKNALKHGVEPRAVRQAAGKREAATIRLSARATPAGAVLEVEDDGRGLDEAGLLRAGEERGLLLLRDARDPGVALAFAPGVSTAERVSDDAGRGLGLADVLERVRALRGRLAFRSTPGLGTLARLTVPPAATTARVLLVRAGSERYALPLASVLGVREAVPEGEGLPLVRLVDLVDPPLVQERRRREGEDVRQERRKRDRFTVITAPPFTRSEGPSDGALGCVVDDVLRRDLVVVRPLTSRFAPPGVDAAALLGDGRVVLVVDVWRLAMSLETSKYRLPRRGGQA